MWAGGPPAGSCSLAPSWSRGDEVRMRLGRTFRDKGLTSSFSQAGAAFCRGEPSRQLPQRKMGSPGTGVRAATALGVLCFCLTGEESPLGTGGGGGSHTATWAPAEPLCSAGTGRVLSHLSQSSSNLSTLISTSRIQQATHLTLLSLHFLF